MHNTHTLLHPNQGSLSPNTVRYLKLLGLDEHPVNFDLVRAMQLKHIARFSFNSLAVITGQEPQVDSESVFEKIVLQERGGYCFEHNKLMFDLLKDLGFQVEIKVGRVVQPDNDLVARTHRLTLLTWQDKQYIVDVGFGANCALHPILIEHELEQLVVNDRFRVLIEDGGEYRIQRWHNGEFRNHYNFDLARYSEADCGMGHFYSSQHPQAAFVNNLVVSLKTEHTFWSLRNHLLFIVTKDGTKEVQIVDAVQLQTVLLEFFHMNIDLSVCEFLFTRFVLPKIDS